MCARPTARLHGRAAITRDCRLNNTTTDALAGAHGSSTVAGVFVMIAILVAGYFLPAMIAILRKHPQKLAISVLNLVIGWTVIGWVGALIWSLTSPAQPQTIIVQTPIHYPGSTPPPPA